MSHSLDAQAALESFRNYIGEGAGARKYIGIPRDACLLDYIDAWLWEESGESAIIRCGGNFEVFLTTVTFIVDLWHKDPKLLFGLDADGKMIERRASSAFGEKGHEHQVFHPQNFIAAKFFWTTNRGGT